MNLSDAKVLRLAQAFTEILESNTDTGPMLVSTARYVTIALASAKTGLTEKAIRKKIEDGVWVEDSEYRRSPDGGVMVDMEGYNKWVEKGVGSKSGKRVSG